MIKMIYQLSFIIIIILGAVIYSAKYGKESARLKPFVVFVCIVLTLQSGLRHVAVGPDTYAYFVSFENISHWRWEKVFHNFINVYINGEGKDAGYSLIVKCFTSICRNYQVYLIAVAALFFTSFGILLIRFCKDVRQVVIAILIYQAFYYAFFSITGIRQTIATSLLFFSVPYIINRKFVKFLILNFIAVFIHKSALLFFPFYFIANINQTRILLLSGICFLPLTFAYRKQIGLFMTHYEFTSQYSAYIQSSDAGAIGFISYLVVLAIGVLFIRKRYMRTDMEWKIMSNALTLSLLFSPLTFLDSGLMRVVQYFSVFSMFMFPAVISSITKEKNMQIIMSIVLGIILLALIVSRNTEYGFFWQTMQLGSNYDSQIII